MLMLTSTKNGSKEEMDETKQVQHPKTARPYPYLLGTLIAPTKAYSEAALSPARPLLLSTPVNHNLGLYHLMQS